jgi:hypothetical protein
MKKFKFNNKNWGYYIYVTSLYCIVRCYYFNGKLNGEYNIYFKNWNIWRKYYYKNGERIFRIN